MSFFRREKLLGIFVCQDRQQEEKTNDNHGKNFVTVENGKEERKVLLQMRQGQRSEQDVLPQMPCKVG